MSDIYVPKLHGTGEIKKLHAGFKTTKLEGNFAYDEATLSVSAPYAETLGPYSATSSGGASGNGLPATSGGWGNMSNIYSSDNQYAFSPGQAQGKMYGGNFNVADLSLVNQILKVTAQIEAYGEGNLAGYITLDGGSNWYQSQGGAQGPLTGSDQIFTFGNNGWSGAPAYTKDNLTNANLRIAFIDENSGRVAYVDHVTVSVQVT